METTGRMVPVDAAPDEDGRVTAHNIGGVLYGHVLTKGEQPPDNWSTFMAHFANCEARTRRRRGSPRPRTIFDDMETETR